MVSAPAKPADSRPMSDLNSELVKGLAAPEIHQRFIANGGEPASSTPDELRRYMIEESACWAKTIKMAGIRIE